MLSISSFQTPNLISCSETEAFYNPILGILDIMEQNFDYMLLNSRCIKIFFPRIRVLLGEERDRRSCDQACGSHMQSEGGEERENRKRTLKYFKIS